VGVNAEKSDFQARLLVIAREAEALVQSLPPGVARTRAQHIATDTRLLLARLEVAAPAMLSPDTIVPLPTPKS
jgi:hypothetical protein